MSDVQTNPQLEQFMEENNLTVLNNTALCAILMKQQEQIDRLSKFAEHTDCDTWQLCRLDLI